MKLYAVIRDYGNAEEQVTFGESDDMFTKDQKHVKQESNDVATIQSFEKKYGIKLEWREAKPKTHFGWFVCEKIQSNT